jgi:hypothetical protein
MSEDAEIESSRYSITAGDWDAMFPCFNEVVVEDDLPLSVHELAMTERQKGFARGILASRLLRSKGFERIGELQDSHQPSVRSQGYITDALKVGNMIGQVTRGFASSVF